MSISTTTSISLAILCAVATGSAVAEPPEPTRESPYQFQCTLAFTDTTCQQIVEAWASDNEIDSASLTIAVECGDCQERELYDYEGNRHVVGYTCQRRAGYQVVAQDLQAPVKVFRTADANEGWAVEGWDFHACLNTWVCADDCANVQGTVTCIPIRLIRIGRWMPVIGPKCKGPTKEDYGYTSTDDGGSGAAYGAP